MRLKFSGICATNSNASLITTTATTAKIPNCKYFWFLSAIDTHMLGIERIAPTTTGKNETKKNATIKIG